MLMFKQCSWHEFIGFFSFPEAEVERWKFLWPYKISHTHGAYMVNQVEQHEKKFVKQVH